MSSIRRRKRKISDPRRIEARGARRARNHIDRANVLADLRDGDPGKQELELFADITGREPDSPQPILVENEVKRWDALAPVGVDGSHRRIVDHDCADLAGDRTHLADVRSADPEGDGERGRRPED